MELLCKAEHGSPLTPTIYISKIHFIMLHCSLYLFCSLCRWGGGGGNLVYVINIGGFSFFRVNHVMGEKAISALKSPKYKIFESVFE